MFFGVSDCFLMEFIRCHRIIICLTPFCIIKLFPQYHRDKFFSTDNTKMFCKTVYTLISKFKGIDFILCIDLLFKQFTHIQIL